MTPNSNKKNVSALGSAGAVVSAFNAMALANTAAVFGATVAIGGAWIAAFTRHQKIASSDESDREARSLGSDETPSMVSRQNIAANNEDDLKKISGVGPAIEKKLHKMGVTSYQQIANWGSADIEKADEVLNFKGRIIREKWVEQANILANDGET